MDTPTSNLADLVNTHEAFSFEAVREATIKAAATPAYTFEGTLNNLERRVHSGELTCGWNREMRARTFRTASGRLVAYRGAAYVVTQQSIVWRDGSPPELLDLAKGGSLMWPWDTLR